MSVAVEGDSPRFEAGVPKPLFAVHSAPFPHRHRYVVAPDGARFLLNEALQESSTTMTVVVNWTTELKK